MDYHYKHFSKSTSVGKVAFHQKERNTIFPGQQLEPSNFLIVVREEGITINGNFGTNPSADVIAETAMVFQECVEALNSLRQQSAPTLKQAKALPAATHGTYIALASDDPRARLILDWYYENSGVRARSVAVKAGNELASLELMTARGPIATPISETGEFKDANAALAYLLDRIEQEKEPKS